MTRKRIACKTPARKGTTSKVWKDSLRAVCLNRARQRRSLTRSPGMLTESELKNARVLVDEAMMQQGVSLLSTCTCPNNTPQLRSPYTSVVADEHLEDEPMEAHDLFPVLSNNDADFLISEEELFDLLAEVEAEIEKTDSLQLDEMLQAAHHDDQLDLEERIAEYQHWEQAEEEESVLCPLCHDANLLKSQGRLLCPNHMGQSCSFDIENPLDLSLNELRERLRVAYDQHASYCHANLSFETTHGTMADSRSLQEKTNLVAFCSACETRMHIA